MFILLVTILFNCYAILYNSVCIQCVLQCRLNPALNMPIFKLLFKLLFLEFVSWAFQKLIFLPTSQGEHTVQKATLRSKCETCKFKPDKIFQCRASVLLCHRRKDKSFISPRLYYSHRLTVLSFLLGSLLLFILNEAKHHNKSPTGTNLL